MDHDPNQNPLFQLFRSAFHHQASAAEGGDSPAQPTTQPSETSVSQNPSGPHAQDLMDIDYDDMPGLQELSDSDAESDSDRDADEVEMQAVDRNNNPDATPHMAGISPASRQASNRRPRVDDDDDEERDRRHPSQRVSSVNNNAASSSSSAQASGSLPHIPHAHDSTPTSSSGPTDTPHPPPPRQPNVQRHVFHTTFNLGPGGPANQFRLFQQLFPQNNTNEPNPTSPNTHNTDNPNLNAGNNDNNAAPDPPLAQAQQPPQPPNANNGPRPQQPIFGGVLSFDIGPGLLFGLPTGEGPPPNAVPGANPPLNAQIQGMPTPLADLLSRIGAQVMGGFGLDNNQEDPERARKLVDGLEVVPEGLVKRLERVGGSGGGMGEDSTKGGDSGCAICWDRLLDTDGEGWGTETEEGSSAHTEKKHPKIVSLPCAHVFHADCLIPWFSRPRQTTCPTCRFNIDPDNLTYVPWSVRQRERREAEAAAARPDEGDQPAAPGGTEEPAAAAPTPDAPHTADAPADVPPPGAAPAPAPANTDPHLDVRDHIMRQLASLYAGQNPELAGLFGAGRAPQPANAQAQPQAGQQPQPPQPPQHRPGPAVTVASIPITIPIPVAIPLGGIHTVASPNLAPSTSAAPGQPQASQATPQGGAEPSGDYRRLYNRLFRPNVLVPVNVSSSPLFFRPGTAQASTSATDGSGSANAPATAGPAPPEGESHEPASQLRARLSRLNLGAANPPRPPIDFTRLFGQGFPPGFGFGLGPDPQGAANANQPAPAPGARPTQGNTFNLEGLDFGIPGIRADVVVTMDMFFDPVGPGGALPHDHNGDDGHDHDHDHDHLPPLEPVGGEMEMEEDIMMMPEDGELEQEQEEQHFQAMMDMFTGRAPPPGNVPRTRQQQPQGPPAADQPQGPTSPPPAGMTDTFHIAAGAGRSMGEAFAQLLAGIGRPPQGQQGQDAQAAPEAGAPAQPAQPGDAPAPDAQPQPLPRQPLPRMRAGGFAMPPLFPQFPDIFGPGARRAHAPGPKPAWTLPAAPGPTLRQRIERREREAGLRCYDVSCGLGPSDEDPFTDEVSKTVSGMKQLVIRHKDEEHAEVCDHRFHSACLVSAERVFLRGADAAVEDGRVDVSCPVCRGAGVVTREEWNEGVAALQ